MSHVCRLQRREPSQGKHGWRLGLLALLVPSLRCSTSPTRLIPALLPKGPCLCSEQTNTGRLFRLECQRKHGPWQVISCVTGACRWAITGHEWVTLELAAFCPSSRLVIFLRHILWQPRATFVGNRNVDSQRFRKAQPPIKSSVFVTSIC